MLWTAQFDSVLAVDERLTLFPFQNKKTSVVHQNAAAANQEVSRVVKEQLIVSAMMAAIVHVNSTDH